MNNFTQNNILSTILKHDTKVTSYKIALLRSINDVVLSFPSLMKYEKDIAVPLTSLAEYWVAYYWPFINAEDPVYQGQKVKNKNDISFRPELEALRKAWREIQQGVSPSDGFYLINEMRIKRKYEGYLKPLLPLYEKTINKIAKAIENPIKYAGPEHWEVFEKPARFDKITRDVTPIPETKPNDKCVIIPLGLWQTFHNLSLWVEALSIHEWCLFTESLKGNIGNKIDRGDVYRMLTARPDNRISLSWERNRIDILMMEGNDFFCPWTHKKLAQKSYDLDHIFPISIYPINELWNLIPSDPNFNLKKSNRIPSEDRLTDAKGYLQSSYENYIVSPELHDALKSDAAIRFSEINQFQLGLTELLPNYVIEFVNNVAEARNLERF